MKKSMKIGQKVYAIFPRFIDPIVRNDNASFPCFPGENPIRPSISHKSIIPIDERIDEYIARR